MSRRTALFLLLMATSVILAGCAAIPLDEVRGDLPIQHKTRLMLAAGTGDRVAVEQALAIGEPVNAKSEEGWTAMHFGAVRGSVDVVELLLQHGADVNAMNDYLVTPLDVAVVKGNTPLVRVLEEHGADLNVRDGQGATPMHLAVAQGETPIVRILAEHGADLNVRDGQGATPMHLAALKEKDDLVALLATRGATVQPVGSDPPNVLATAVEYRAVGRVQSQKGDRAGASESYSRAAEYLEKASEGYHLAADKARSEAFRTRVAGWTMAAVIVALEVGSAALAQQQATMNARQMAQYDALSKAARGQPGPGHGIGEASYITPGSGTSFGFRQQAALLDDRAASYEAIAKKSAATAIDCRRQGACP